MIERQMGNIIKNMSKEKRDELKQNLEEAETHLMICVLCISYPL